MRLLGFAVATPILALSASVSAQQSTNDAEHNWAAITQCGSMRETEARHQCMDDVLRRAGRLAAVRTEPERSPEFGRNRRTEIARAPSPTPPAATSDGKNGGTADEIVTTIKAVGTVGYQTLRITTAEGSVWQQTQAAPFTTDPEVGDRFSVIRAAFGSYLCKFGNSSRYRCERTD